MGYDKGRRLVLHGREVYVPWVGDTPVRGPYRNHVDMNDGVRTVERDSEELLDLRRCVTLEDGIDIGGSSGRSRCRTSLGQLLEDSGGRCP